MRYGRLEGERSLAMTGKSLFLFLSALLSIIPSPCAAQNSSSAHAQGYVFVAPGLWTHEETVSGTLHFGGGGEAFIHKGLAAGAEIGYVLPWRAPGDGIGMLSLDASYHVPRGSKLAVFVTGGYSLGFRSQTANFLNLGGGATYWFKKKEGIRFEVRNHFYTESMRTDYLDFRLGFAFR
jgi:hypothetical protein